MTASDIYTYNIEDAVFSQDSPLTLTFDYDETKDTGTIAVCYYDDTSDKWLKIDSPITKDLVSGTLEIDFTARDIKTAGGASMFSYAPFVKGVGYIAEKAVQPSGRIMSSLSGVKFAVFTAAPSYIPPDQGQEESNAVYSGDKFRIYNFPNPFNLSEKSVTLANTGTNSSLAGEKTVSGTVLKYYLPDQYDTGSGASIKFYIYNLAGELVRVIDDEPRRDGGYIYFREWDGRNDRGQKCASGVYLLIPYVNGEAVTKNALKLAIVK